MSEADADMTGRGARHKRPLGEPEGREAAESPSEACVANGCALHNARLCSIACDLPRARLPFLAQPNPSCLLRCGCNSRQLRGWGGNNHPYIIDVAEHVTPPQTFRKWVGVREVYPPLFRTIRATAFVARTTSFSDMLLMVSNNSATESLWQ